MTPHEKAMADIARANDIARERREAPDPYSDEGGFGQAMTTPDTPEGGLAALIGDIEKQGGSGVQPMHVDWRMRDRILAALRKHDAAVDEAVERKVLDTLYAAKFPKERWSCGLDESGVALTLQRQQHWLANEAKNAFAAIRQSNGGEHNEG